MSSVRHQVSVPAVNSQHAICSRRRWNTSCPDAAWRLSLHCFSIAIDGDAAPINNLFIRVKHRRSKVTGFVMALIGLAVNRLRLCIGFSRRSSRKNLDTTLFSRAARFCQKIPIPHDSISTWKSETGSFMKIFNARSKDIARYYMEMYNVQAHYYAIIKRKRLFL